MLLRQSKKPKLNLSRELQFLKTYWSKKSYMIYLAGSYSSQSKKKPTKKSDIDLFIFLPRKDIKTKNIYRKDERLMHLFKVLLGRKVDVFLVDEKYIDSVSVGMDFIGGQK